MASDDTARAAATNMPTSACGTLRRLLCIGIIPEGDQEIADLFEGSRQKQRRSLSPIPCAGRSLPPFSLSPFSLSFSAQYRQSFLWTPILLPRLWVSVVSFRHETAVLSEREMQPAGLSTVQSLREAGRKSLPPDFSPTWALSTNRRPRQGRHRAQGRFRPLPRGIPEAVKCSNAI